MIDLGFSVAGARRRTAMRPHRCSLCVCASAKAVGRRSTRSRYAFRFSSTCSVVAMRPRESALLEELFGEPVALRGHAQTDALDSRNRDGTRPSKHETEVDLPIPCSYDFEVAAHKYLASLKDGIIPLNLLFSGMAFVDRSGRLTPEFVPWSCEARFALPVAVWREAVDAFFPNSAWIRVNRDLFDELRRFKIANRPADMGCSARAPLRDREDSSGESFRAGSRRRERGALRGLHPLSVHGVGAQESYSLAVRGDRARRRTPPPAPASLPRRRPRSCSSASAIRESTCSCAFCKSRRAESRRGLGIVVRTGCQSLAVGSQTYLTFDEGVEREVPVSLERVGRRRESPFRSRSATKRTSRRCATSVTICAAASCGGAGRCTASITVAVRAGRRATRRCAELRIRIENHSTVVPGERSSALRTAFVSSHTLLYAHGGRVLSALDPPAESIGRRPRRSSTGTRGRCSSASERADSQRSPLVLSSPIILYDFPAVAPQSEGDTFDATEVDELMMLSVLSLSDEERDEARATDPRARAIVERAERFGARGTGPAARHAASHEARCHRAARSLRRARRSGDGLRLRRRHEGRKGFDRPIAPEAPRRRVGSLSRREGRDGARDPPRRRESDVRRGDGRRRSGERSPRLVRPFVLLLSGRSRAGRRSRSRSE